MLLKKKGLMTWKNMSQVLCEVNQNYTAEHSMFLILQK